LKRTLGPQAPKRGSHDQFKTNRGWRIHRAFCDVCGWFCFVSLSPSFGGRRASAVVLRTAGILRSAQNDKRGPPYPRHPRKSRMKPDKQPGKLLRRLAGTWLGIVLTWLGTILVLREFTSSLNSSRLIVLAAVVLVGLLGVWIWRRRSYPH